MTKITKLATATAAFALLAGVTAPAHAERGIVAGAHGGVGCFAFTTDGSTWQAILLSNPGATLQGNMVLSGHQFGYDVQTTNKIPCNTNVAGVPPQLPVAVNFNIPPLDGQ